MTRLTVFYDPRCGRCCAVRDWLTHQPELMVVECRRKQEMTALFAGLSAYRGPLSCALGLTPDAK